MNVSPNSPFNDSIFKAEMKDKIWRVQNLYKIKTKRRKASLMKFNRVQQGIVDSIFNMRPIRKFDLKTRQQGVSTFWLLWWLDDTLFTPNTNSGILAHKLESLNYLMEIVRFAHATMPANLRLPTIGDNKTEMAFKYNNSKIFSSLSIRSTALHNLHISEWCLCKDVEIEATLGACSEWTNISGESTGQGVGNHGYDTYQEARRGDSIDKFKASFWPWFIQEEYEIPCDLTLKQMVLTRAETAIQKVMKDDWKMELTPGKLLWYRNMSKRVRGIMKQEYPTTEDDAFLTSGVKFFNVKKLHALLKEAELFNRDNPPWREEEDFIAFTKPEPGEIYAAGADTQDEGADFSVLKILNVSTRKEAFRYRARCGIKTFYRVCNDWGRAYNNALLAVERNNHGHAVLLGLEENCGYPKLFKDDAQTRLDRKIYVGKKPRALPEPKFGWLTTSITRPLMLDQLKASVEGEDEADEVHFEPEFSIRDREFLQECLTFEEVTGKFQAIEGAYDDNVFATALAFQMYLRLISSVKQRGQFTGIVAVGKRQELD